MQWNGRSMSSKHFTSLKWYLLFFLLHILFSFSLFCAVAASPHCLDSVCLFVFKYRTSWEIHVHIIANLSSFSALVVIHQSTSILLDHLVSCCWADSIYFSVSGVKVENGSESEDGVFEGKRGDDEDSMCLSVWRVCLWGQWWSMKRANRR